MHISEYAHSEQHRVQELLSFLPNSYPNAEQWLHKRLTDETGLTRILLLQENNHLIGVAILVHKSNSRLKLATLYVHPNFRKLGGGRMLMTEALSYAENHKMTGVYLTGDSSLDTTLGVFLLEFGFCLEASKLNLYWPGRTGKHLG